MTGWGMRAVHFRDPENNLIEIWSELVKEKWDKDLQNESKEYQQ
jgi:catechol-2,3-dioxygenase